MHANVQRHRGSWTNSSFSDRPASSSHAHFHHDRFPPERFYDNGELNGYGERSWNEDREFYDKRAPHDQFTHHDEKRWTREERQWQDNWSEPRPDTNWQRDRHVAAHKPYESPGNWGHEQRNRPNLPEDDFVETSRDFTANRSHRPDQYAPDYDEFYRSRDYETQWLPEPSRNAERPGNYRTNGSDSYNEDYNRYDDWAPRQTDQIFDRERRPRGYSEHGNLDRRPPEHQRRHSMGRGYPINLGLQPRARSPNIRIRPPSRANTVSSNRSQSMTSPRSPGYAPGKATVLIPAYDKDVDMLPPRRELGRRSMDFNTPTRVPMTNTAPHKPESHDLDASPLTTIPTSSLAKVDSLSTINQFMPSMNGKQNGSSSTGIDSSNMRSLARTVEPLTEVTTPTSRTIVTSGPSRRVASVTSTGLDYSKSSTDSDAVPSTSLDASAMPRPSVPTSREPPSHAKTKEALGTMRFAKRAGGTPAVTTNGSSNIQPPPLAKPLSSVDTNKLGLRSQDQRTTEQENGGLDKASLITPIATPQENPVRGATKPPSLREDAVTRPALNGTARSPTPPVKPEPKPLPPMNAQSMVAALRYSVIQRRHFDRQTYKERVDPIIAANMIEAETPAKGEGGETLIAGLVERFHHDVALDVYGNKRARLSLYMAERQVALNEKNAKLRRQYLQLHRSWTRHCSNLDVKSPTETPDAAQITPAPTRATRRSAVGLGDAVRSDLEMEQIIASLGFEVNTDPNHLALRNLATIPDMISVTNEPLIQYTDSNCLVVDPHAFYKVDSGIVDWTDEEKEIFKQQFAAFPKQFGQIAEHLPHKTTAQCVAFYYLHKRTQIDFRKVMTLYAPGKRKRGGKTDKQRGNGLLADIARHDNEVKSTVPRAGKRGRASLLGNADDTNTPTPERELAPRQRKRKTARSSATVHDSEDAQT